VGDSVYLLSSFYNDWRAINCFPVICKGPFSFTNKSVKHINNLITGGNSNLLTPDSPRCCKIRLQLYRGDVLFRNFPEISAENHDET
jgi:hypothetical protein